MHANETTPKAGDAIPELRYGRLTWNDAANEAMAREYGSTVRALRRLGGKTQKELAADLGISNKTLSGIENGLIWPELELDAKLRFTLEQFRRSPASPAD